MLPLYNFWDITNIGLGFLLSHQMPFLSDSLFFVTLGFELRRFHHLSYSTSPSVTLVCSVSVFKDRLLRVLGLSAQASFLHVLTS
jgi:hypothetical protein